MKLAVALLLALVAGQAHAATPCLTFDGEQYCLAWASVDGATTSNEYLRAGDTVEKWARMVTVKEYSGTKELKDFLPGYIKAVKPYLALKPEIFSAKGKTHEDEICLLLLLLAPDKSHYEYVVHRTYVDKGGPVRSVLFSLRIPFAKEVSFDDVMKSQGRWMSGLIELEPQAYPAVPTNEGVVEGGTNEKSPSN
jgi:hypothetical protein